MPRTHDELDAWAREHDLQHLREKAERHEADVVLLDSVKRHVDVVIAPLKDVPAKIEALVQSNERLVASNDEQLDISRGALEERGRRKEREELAALKKAEEATALEKQKASAAIELESQKLLAAVEAQKATERIEALKQRNARLQIIAAGVTAIAVALIGAYLAHK